MTAEDDLRRDVVRVAHQLGERALAVGTSGNVSARLDDGRIALTPATMDYTEMSPDDVVIVGPDGSLATGGVRRPSSELALHLARFAARADIGAIVHTHSPFATAFAAARRPIPAVHYVMAQLVAPGHDVVRVAPYATFGTDDLAQNAVDTLGDDHAVLLASHGAVCVAASLLDGYRPGRACRGARDADGSCRAGWTSEPSRGGRARPRPGTHGSVSPAGSVRVIRPARLPEPLGDG